MLLCSVQVYDENMFAVGEMTPGSVDAAWVASTTGGLTPVTGLSNDFSSSPSGMYSLNLCVLFQSLCLYVGP